MDYNQIKILVDKYFEAETSLLEEEQLKTFYKSNATLPPDLERYREHFQYIGSTANIKLGEDFEQKLRAEINALEKGKLEQTKPGIIRFLKPLVSIAALFAVLFFAGKFYQNMTGVSDNGQMAYVVINNEKIEDPQKAYEIMKASLAVISTKMNNGKSKLIHLKQFKTSQKIIKVK